MTNPNPSPECDCARRYDADQIEHQAVCATLAKPECPACNGTKVVSQGGHDTGCDACYVSPQTLPAPGEVEEVARIVKWIDEAIERTKKHGATEGVWLFGSQWSVVRSILATVAAANDEGVARKWFPHLCWAGEPMHEGQFREPWPMDEERTALAKAIFDGWYEGNEDWDSPHNDHLQTRAYFAADAAIRLLSQGGGKA